MTARSQHRLERLQALAERDIGPDELAAAAAFCRKARVALFIVAYNAERHLGAVIDRIPAALLPVLAEIFIIDDSSSDRTYRVALDIAADHPEARIRVYRTPFNRGYGGNQKLGYLYAIRRGFDFVVLLHGDGQYAPEYLPRILAACAGGADAVLASRMLDRKEALRGGMPVYKWIGNRMLTAVGNRLLGTRFAEFHTGYRAYRVQALAGIPFSANTDDFHFDGEILAQGALARWRIVEVPIPTYYGDEICHVPGFRYGLRFLKSLLAARLTRIGIFYQKNFDVGLYDEEIYTYKRSPHSLHQWVLNTVRFEPGLRTVELGANRGLLSAEVASRVGTHVAVDRFRPDAAGAAETHAVDLNGPFSEKLGRGAFDLCLALDVAEHLASPEAFAEEVFRMLKAGGTAVLSTANVAYLPVRAALLFGQFNYGKRGILDMTHTRLFTVASFTRMLRQNGFRVEKVRGFPPPFTDMVGAGRGWRWLEAVHAALSRRLPKLFAFNFAVVATRMDDVDDILRRTVEPVSGDPHRDGGDASAAPPPGRA